jgi:hypothetical protein
LKRLTAIFAALVMLAAEASAAPAPKVAVRLGDAWLERLGSPPRQFTKMGNVVEAHLSPDSNSIAFVRRDKPGDTMYDPDFNSLWLMDATSGARSRQLLSWRQEQNQGEGSLMAIGSLHWSSDNSSIYFLTTLATTSSGVHQVDVRTGRQHFVVDGDDLQIIQNGPYEGKLLLARHTCHVTPSFCDYPISVVRLDGSVVSTIPNSGGTNRDAVVNQWLRRHHWTAS